MHGGAIDADKKGFFIHLYKNTPGVTNFVLPLSKELIPNVAYLIKTSDNSLWRGVFIFYPSDYCTNCQTTIKEWHYNVLSNRNYCPFCYHDLTKKEAGLFYEFCDDIDLELIDEKTRKIIIEKVKEDLRIPIKYRLENNERVYE